MTLKKVLPFILIAIVILGIFFGFLNARPISAQTTNPAGSAYSGKTVGGVVEWYAPSVGSETWFTGLAADAAYYILWIPASWFMGLGGWTMNKGISISITGSTFSTMATGEDSAVTVGWGIARDIVNLFLIFILLYIAISTILQVPGYGAKELLLTLIIIAFLVNFSLVITKLIIDASNILTMGFYNVFTTTDSSGQISISKTFENALDTDKLISADISKIESSLTRLLALLFSSALMLIAGFIFLIFGILFVIRMVVLLILMVFSPLAFAAHILPSTKQHASKWWSSLFNQAFFAPAAMFMLYWAAKIAQSNVIKTALGIPETGGSGIGDMIQAGRAENRASDVFAFTLQFFIIAVILCGSLIVAKQMGAYGAESVQAGAKKMGKKLQGYAGRIGKRYAAPLAAATMATKEGKPRWISKVPLVGRGLARATALAEPEIGKYEKQYSSSSDAALNVLMQRQHLLNLSQRKAIKRIQEKRAKKKARQDILKDPNAPSLEKIRALTEEAEETVESAAKTTTTEKKETERETKKT